MQNEKRGIFTTIEAYVDMLINLVSILMGYLFIILIDWGGEAINITHPVAIIIMSTVICQ